MRSIWFTCLGFVLTTVACGGPDTGLELATRAQALDPRDPALTPGALCTPGSRDFEGYAEQGNFARCRRNVSRSRKRHVRATYGIDRNDPQRYEIDHYIPLSIGGSNEMSNLWPMPEPDAREKSRFEFMVFERVTRGEISQSEAIAMFRARW